MEKIIDYNVCRSTSIATLRELVMTEMKLGYQPLGSISTCPIKLNSHGEPAADSDGYQTQGIMYTQALVKYAN